MNSMLQIGQVVRSNCGRDRDNFFIIVKTDIDYIHLVDGSIRSVTKPKKKRRKHVSSTEFTIHEIRDKILLGTSFSNKEVKKRLQEIVQLIQR